MSYARVDLGVRPEELGTWCPAYFEAVHQRERQVSQARELQGGILLATLFGAFGQRLDPAEFMPSAPPRPAAGYDPVHQRILGTMRGLSDAAV